MCFVALVWGYPEDFNESSVVVRLVHEEGSMIFLADCGVYVCEWMLDAYDEALKSDMVQVAHHGGETANKEIYDAIQADTLFWPCNEPLLNSERGLYVKQHTSLRWDFGTEVGQTVEIYSIEGFFVNVDAE